MFIFLANLKLSKIASIFGAVTFGFSPFILTWGEEVVMSPHSVVWLPLILFGIDKYLGLHSRSDVKAESGLHSGSVFLAIISLATAFSLLGGYMQTSIYMLIFVLAYLIFRIFHLEGVKAHLRGVLVIIGALGSGAGIAAIQLLPSAELYFNSARSTVTLRETLFDFLLPIESLLTYLAPDFFGHPATHNFFRPGVAQYYEGIMFVGVATLIFAAFAVFASRFHLRGAPSTSLRAHLGGDYGLVRFLTIFGLVSLSTTLDLPTSKLFLSLPIPFLSTSIANRVLFLPVFCLAILAAIGFERWLVTRDKRILRIIFAFGLAYLLIIVCLLAIKFFKWPYFEYAKMTSDKNVIISLRNLILPLFILGTSTLLIFMTFFAPSFKKIAAFGVLVLAFLHIFLFAQKYFSFSDRKFVFPKNEILDFISQNQGIYRSWGMGSAFFENNFASQYRIFWPEGYDSLNNRSYAEFTYGMQGILDDELVFRADAGLGRNEASMLLDNLNRRRLIDMVGVKYVVGANEDENLLEKNNFSKVFKPAGGKYSVFENQQVMPRVFLASSYEGPPLLSDVTNMTTAEIDKRRRKLIFQKLLSDDFDWRNALILEKPSPISPQFGQGTVEIVTYRPWDVTIKTKSDQPKLLFISDNYYPGWKAQVDGEETEILRANYTFRAVPLIGGEHLVRFYYDSVSFKAGLVISAVSLVGIGYLLFNSKIKIQNLKLR